jgi:hypothetical protein
MTKLTVALRNFAKALKKEYSTLLCSCANGIKSHYHITQRMPNVVLVLCSLVILYYVNVAISEAAATQSIAYAMYTMFAMHGKNSCLYGQRKGPHKTADAMYAMLAMSLRRRVVCFEATLSPASCCTSG